MTKSEFDFKNLPEVFFLQGSKVKESHLGVLELTSIETKKSSVKLYNVKKENTLFLDLFDFTNSYLRVLPIISVSPKDFELVISSYYKGINSKV